MISILHLSDLHIVQNADWNLIRPAIIEQARLLHDRPRGKKLVVITGDFHNFWDEDYSEAVKLILELADAADIDISQDLFVVPGNHDVGNETTMGVCFPNHENWDIEQERAIAELKKLPTGDANYQRFLKLRMNAYEPYCRFLSELGLYTDEERSARLPAAPHVRCWWGNLNILHLNTTLVYAPQKPGEPRAPQRVDLLTATNEAIWKDVNLDLPALALGHNSFFDLDKAHRTGLEAVFKRHGVCAYLCGDTHREERDRDRQMIRLEEGYSGGVQIPNVVGVKSAADDSDTWSDFGLYWHDWDESTGHVTLRLLSWERKRDQSKFKPGGEDSYPMPRPAKPPADPDSRRTSGPAPDTALITHLRDLMDQTRTNHPSFKLMKPDKLDPRLFPRIPARGKVGDGKECPVWDIIVESWQEGRNRPIVLEGEGGIGKTVALLSPTGEAAQSVPALYVQLFELVSGNTRTAVKDYLKQRLEAFWEAFNRLCCQSWAGRPSLLLLLDGVNELPAAHRSHVIRDLNAWAGDHPGVQLVAVSRPLDGMNLRLELDNDPIALTMSPMDEKTVKHYLTELNRALPLENDPIWETLKLPLFLVLYAKTDKLEGRTACTYPLAPKKAANGGALIWNYLQRELLRKNDESWVLQCAVACEYLLPAVGYYMVTNHRFTIKLTELNQILAEHLPRLSGPLPKHLKKMFAHYDFIHEGRPLFGGVKWRSLIIHEIGLLRQYKDDESTFTFLHQHFRDCFAGLYLVNAAEAEAGLPELWRHSQPPLAMEYAARLIEEGTAGSMWNALRKIWPISREALYVQLELFRLRAHGFSCLDFSHMDLRTVNLRRYGKELFQNPTYTRESLLSVEVFQGIGHSKDVTCVAALPNGRIVSGSDDKTLRVWDSYSGDCLQLLKGHEDDVLCLLVLNNGDLISASKDNTIRKWNIEEGSSTVLVDCFGWILCMAELEDGRLVIGQNCDNFYIFDLIEKTKTPLDGIVYWDHCIAGLKNNIIVTASYGNNIRMWDIKTQKCIREIPGHDSSVTCISSLQNRFLISGSRDKTVRIWDMNSNNCRTMRGHSDAVTCIDSIGDSRFVTGSDDKELRIWNCNTEDSIVLKGHEGPVSCVLSLTDGRLVSGSRDGSLLLWLIEKHTYSLRLGRKLPYITCLIKTLKGELLTGHRDGTLRLWDSRTLCCISVWICHHARVTCVGETKDGYLVSGSSDKTIRIWSNNKMITELTGHSNSITCLSSLRNGKLISGSDDHTIREWDLSSGESRLIDTLSDRIRCVIELQDGRIAYGSCDNTFRVFNYTTKEKRVLGGHNGWVLCAVNFPDGKVASGSWDGSIVVWNVDADANDKSVFGLKYHTKPVNCIVPFRKTRIVSGSDDRSIRITDIESKESRKLLGHAGSITGITLLGESRLLSVSIDCTIRIWDINTGNCLAVIPISEMDVTGMNLSKAVMDEKTARLLYYNGAEVPKHYQTKLAQELNPDREE